MLVAFHLLVEALNRDSVEPGEVRIENDLLAVKK